VIRGSRYAEQVGGEDPKVDARSSSLVFETDLDLDAVLDDLAIGDDGT